MLILIYQLYEFNIVSCKIIKCQFTYSNLSAKVLAASEKLTCLYDRPSQGPKWDHNNTMGVPGHFITAGLFTLSDNL